MPLFRPLVAKALLDATGNVDVSAAAAPSANQVLTATGAAAATWQTPGSSTLKQTAFAEVTVDTTTTSTSFVDLLTISFTISASSIVLVWFTASASDTTGTNRSIAFRVTVDGVAIRGAGELLSTTGASSSAALALRVTGLAAGARSVKVQWCVAGNATTAQIRPVSVPDSEHASLLLQEVTV